MIEVVMDDKVIQVSPHMTISQYQKFIKKQEYYQNNPAELLAMYMNISVADLKDMPIKQVNMVESYITSMMAKDFQKDETYNMFEFDGVEYGLENNWSKLAWGAWVDFQVLSSENIQDNIHMLMAILYRPVVSKGKRGKYTIAKYKSDEIEDRAIQFLDLPVFYWLGAASFFFLMSTLYMNNIKSSLVWMNKFNKMTMRGWEVLPRWVQKKVPLDSILLSPTNWLAKT